jgi:tRNA G10  N-methylase Trm11
MSIVYRSVYDNQNDILTAIKELHCPQGFQCDLTYGNGQFWKEHAAPPLRYDLDDSLENIIVASSTSVPLPDNFLDNLVFDPPFLTYVRAGRSGNGEMVMSKRFAGYWTYVELTEHYRDTLKESARLLKKGGVMVFKCQDIVHNHQLQPTHINVVNWASEFGFRLKDMFILTAKHRMPSPNRVGKQKHSRIFHCYFLVLVKA